MDENMPRLTLADGTSVPCAFFGVSSTGRLYIDIFGMTMAEAFAAFGDAEKTKEMTLSAPNAETLTRKGFSVFLGVEVTDGGAVRVTMRRKFEGE